MFYVLLPWQLLFFLSFLFRSRGLSLLALFFPLPCGLVGAITPCSTTWRWAREKHTQTKLSNVKHQENRETFLQSTKPSLLSKLKKNCVRWKLSNFHAPKSLVETIFNKFWGRNLPSVLWAGLFLKKVYEGWSKNLCYAITALKAWQNFRRLAVCPMSQMSVSRRQKSFSS